MTDSVISCSCTPHEQCNPQSGLGHGEGKEIRRGEPRQREDIICLIKRTSNRTPGKK